MANYIVHESTSKFAPICCLQDLFVDPGRRSAGVGKKLIDWLVAEMKSKGWSRLYWHTRENNYRARSLYDKYTPDTGFVRYVIENINSGLDVKFPLSSSERRRDGLHQLSSNSAVGDVRASGHLPTRKQEEYRSATSVALQLYSPRAAAVRPHSTPRGDLSKRTAACVESRTPPPPPLRFPPLHCPQLQLHRVLSLVLL
jgi:hypothetical protein